MAKNICKIMISLGLLICLFYVTGLTSVISKVKLVSIYVVIGCVSILVFAQFLSSWRWQKILSAEGARIPLRYLFSSYMVGMFANNFMPTSIGGDVVKTYDVYRITKNLSLSILSVFMERFSGLLVLLFLSWFGVSMVWQSGNSGTLGVWIAINGICLFFILLFFSRSAGQRIQSHLETSRLFKKRSFFGDTLNAIRAFNGKKSLLALLLLISVPIQLVTIAIYYILSRELGLDISFIFLLFSVPLITILSLLPVSLGGLGVREGTTVLMFGIAGVPAESALALSLVYAGVVYLTGLLGFIYLIPRTVSLREYTSISKQMVQDG